ncbi:DMT family transporter [Fructobacillus durionis]|uniref:Threonine/homoserine efflux transporter RhtA n=1 Tax=Fructobacillus durionis TaxID=283737 RepID=A0A1I1EHM3_9LACO|nr:EamA family transporter [Fructobacillus durionis]SFB86561.1 Threonine/homoserine efflux transporter RhtA [Fructobacillus durionis]
MKSKTNTGLLFAIIGGVFWGASGTVAEYVFSVQHVPSTWLVGIRLLSAGLLLLGVSVTLHQDIFAIWHKWSSVISLLLFSFFGMLPSQLAYFMAIQYGNAPTATVLQFLGPIFIILYLALSSKHWPSRINTISVFIAVTGTFLLVTSGNIKGLSFSLAAILWGIGAGLSQASYTLLPRKLLIEFDDTLVVGWGMFLSSIPFLGVIFNSKVTINNVGTASSIVFIVIFGTMLAYLFYLKSLRYISPSITGMLSSFEPLTATLLSITFLHVTFNFVQLIGGALILSTVFLQYFFNKE